MKIKSFKEIPPGKNFVTITVEGDINDGDYRSEQNFFSVEEFKKLYNILKKIDDNDGDFENCSNFLTKDEELLIKNSQIIPQDSNGFAHTIIDIDFKFTKS